MEEPASALAGQPTTKQSTVGGRTRPSTAATAQHYHTYKSEEEVGDDGREFHAAARHLLHALRYQVSGSATLLVDHLIAQFIDLMRRERRCVASPCSRWSLLLRLD
jgi:hypothetical protein